MSSFVGARSVRSSLNTSGRLHFVQIDKSPGCGDRFASVLAASNMVPHVGHLLTGVRVVFTQYAPRCIGCLNPHRYRASIVYVLRDL